MHEQSLTKLLFFFFSGKIIFQGYLIARETGWWGVWTWLERRIELNRYSVLIFNAPVSISIIYDQSYLNAFMWAVTLIMKQWPLSELF